jgi:hypothetical protein
MAKSIAFAADACLLRCSSVTYQQYAPRRALPAGRLGRDHRLSHSRALRLGVRRSSIGFAGRADRKRSMASVLPPFPNQPFLTPRVIESEARANPCCRMVNVASILALALSRSVQKKLVHSAHARRQSEAEPRGGARDPVWQLGLGSDSMPAAAPTAGALRKPTLQFSTRTHGRRIGRGSWPAGEGK